MRAETRKPDEVRDLVAYADAYGPLADELEALNEVRPLQHPVRSCRGRSRGADDLRPGAAHVEAPGDRLPRPVRRRHAPRPQPSPEALAKKAATRAAKAAAKVGIAVPAAEPDPRPQNS